MAKVNLHLDKLNIKKNPYEKVENIDNNHILDKEIEENISSSKVEEKEDMIIPKINVIKKEKYTSFSYYGKEIYIDKVKKLAKYYKVTPSAILDSILESYFTAEKLQNKDSED